MHKHVALLGVVLVLVIFGTWWWQMTNISGPREMSDDSVLPDAESAEQVGFAFMRDMVTVTQGTTDPGVSQRLFESLSTDVQSKTSPEMVGQYMPLFSSMHAAPEQGVSVEDLQIHNPTEATLFVGLHYNTGRTIHAVHLIAEEGRWKVRSIEVVENSLSGSDSEPNVDPFVPEVPPEPTPKNVPGPSKKGACYVGGCSSQICSDRVDDVASTCEWREEYACYRSAVCERQVSGECGWTKTDALTQCLAEAVSKIVQ